MLCRIETRRDNDQWVVRLAGRLGEAQVPDLFEVCARAHAPLILELDELVSADAVGIDALRRIEAQGARLLGLPEYLRLNLSESAGERGR